jgi:uroporphyrinogen-III synthase
MGGAALILPLFEIAPTSAPLPDHQPFQAVVFTSANGVRTAPAGLARALPAFAVGDATAVAAQAAGFSTVVSADADGAALAALITARLRPDAGAVLHVRGEDVAFDVSAALQAAGFQAEAVIAYRSEALDALSPAQRMAAAAAQGVLFHSARGAAVGARLMAPLAPQLAAICISAAAKAAAQDAPFARFAVAERPMDEALVALAFAQTEAKG